MSETSIFESPEVKTCMSRLCSITPFTVVSHYWWKQSFRIFGMGFDQPSAKLETAKKVLSYSSRHILSYHPCLHPSEWVPRSQKPPI